MKKLIAITLCLLMVLSSLAYVSMDADAEDSTRPFVGMNTGYPGSEVVLDQSNNNPFDWYGIYATYTLGQTFKPGVTGKLLSIDLAILGNGPGSTSYDYTFEIRDTNLGLPQNIIASETVTLSLTDTIYYWVNIEFSAKPDLTAGTEYAIVAKYTGIDYMWYFSNGETYTGGTTVRSSNGGVTWTTIANDFNFKTNMEVPLGGLDKVAWHDSGNYALAVTGLNDQVWKFTRETGAWSSLGAIYSGATFSDVIYDDFSGRFYIVGWKSAITPLAIWWTEAAGFFDAGAPAVSGKLIAADTCGGVNGYHLLAVGDTGGQGYAAWYDGSSWTEITSGFNLSFPETLKDVTWNQRTGAASKHFAIGVDDEYTTPLYEFGVPGSNTTARIYWSHADELSTMNAISWSPRWAEGSQYDYAIMVGDNDETYNYGSVYKFDGVNRPVAISTSTDIFYDVAWTTDGTMAAIVGEDASGNGKVFHHGAGTDLLADMTSDLPPGSGALLGIAYKGYTSPSSGIIVGASGGMATYPSATDSLTTITVNAAFPHMWNLDMWKTSDGSQTSTLNKAVDVETTYTFYTEINYTVSGVDKLFDGVNNTFVDLLIWYDEGAEAGTPTPDASHRTRYSVARWYETAGPGPASVTGAILYPIGAPGEFTLDGVGCSGPFGADDRYAVWMNISFGAQMRAADGGGFSNGASTNIYDAGQSQNDANSWNIAYTVFDNDFTGASNITYEEFGVNKLSNVTVSGSPSGNAPPGSSNNSLGNSLITYSSNVPHYVNVSLPNLTGSGGEIEASNIALSMVGAYPVGFDYNAYTEVNSSWGAFGRAFSGSDSPRMIWGNASRAPANQLIAAPDNGTTAHGPWGSNYNGFGATQIAWWASVPASTAEGVYTATITFEIGEY